VIPACSHPALISMEEGLGLMRFIGAGTRRGFNYRVRRTFWTVPNIITVARFLLVPVFVGYLDEGRYGAATIVLAILGCTDWVDGYVARRFDQISTVGRWLDPLADRLALIIIAVAFVVEGLAPLWLLLCIVIPDGILLVYSLVLFRGSPDLPVTNVGKIRTALLLIGTPLLLLARALGPQFQWSPPWLTLSSSLAAPAIWWPGGATCGRQSASMRSSTAAGSTAGSQMPSRPGAGRTAGDPWSG